MSIARQQAYVQDVRNWSVCRPSCHGELSVVIMWCQLQASSSLTRQTIEAEAKGSHHIDCFVRSAIVGALLPFITTVTAIVLVHTRGLIPYFPQLLNSNHAPNPMQEVLGVSWIADGCSASGSAASACRGFAGQDPDKLHHESAPCWHGIRGGESPAWWLICTGCH